MVNPELAERAITDAEEWLRSAEKLKEIDAAPKVLYSLEMAAELSLKGLLLYHGIDYPKTHNILPLVIRLISSGSFPDDSIRNHKDMIYSVFHALLDLRSAGGNSYESSYSKDFSIEKANECMGQLSIILDLIRKKIKR